MSKKVLGVILALTMLLGVFSVTVFAVADIVEEEDPSLYTQNWSVSDPVAVAGGYQVNVILTTNYKVGPISFKLEGAGEVISAEVGSGYYAGSYCSPSASGLVLITPNTNSTVEAKVMTNAVVAVVTISANTTPTISNNPKTLANPDGTLVAIRCDADTVGASNFIIGQTATTNGAPVVPPVTTATLTGVNGGIVDDENRYIYGVPGKTADPTTYFSTTGYMEMTANSAGAKNGTGAVLNLYSDSSKGTLVKSYTLVIFGDLDGDGEAALPDAGILSQYANYVTDADSLTGAYYFAGDLDGDGETALPDSGILSQYANYVTDVITVNPWAA